MIFLNTQLRAYNIANKRLYVRENLLECYHKLCNGADIIFLIREHKKFIDRLQLISKNKSKYKTITYLERYKNTINKASAMMVLTNTLNNMKDIYISI